MGVNSITFRIGGDLSGMRRDMADAQNLAVKTAGETKARMDAITKSTKAMTGEAAGGAGGHGHGGLGSSGSRAIGDSLDAITGSRGWVMRMTMLQHSLPIAALAGLAIGFEKVTEAVLACRDATKEASDVLSEGHFAAGAGPGEAAHQYEALTKAIDKLKESRTLAAKVGDAYSGGTAIQRSLQMQARLESERLEIARAFNLRLQEETDARRQAEGVSEREVEHLRVKQGLEEKIAQIRTTAAPGMRASQIAAARSDASEHDATIDRKADALEAERQLEAAILSAKIHGRDVSIQEGVERLVYAQKIYEAARSDEEQKAAWTKVQAAEEALKQTERETAEHRRQIDIEAELAGIRGDADVKHMAALIAEGEELRKRLADTRTKEDDRQKLRSDLAKNQAAQRDASNASGLKAFDIGADIIDANRGPGKEGEQLALLQKIELEKSKIAFLDQSGAGPEAIAKANAHLAEMQRQYSEIRRSQTEAAGDAAVENHVLEEKLQQHEAIGELLRSQYEFAKKIADAQRDGNNALAQQLEKQRQLSVQAQVQNLQRQVGDRSKATIAELAANAHNRTGQEAREVQRLEARANRQRVQGHSDAAAKLQGQADKLKQGITPLKSADKQEALLGEQLTELKKIAEGITKVRAEK